MATSIRLSLFWMILVHSSTVLHWSSCFWLWHFLHTLLEGSPSLLLDGSLCQRNVCNMLERTWSLFVLVLFSNLMLIYWWNNPETSTSATKSGTVIAPLGSDNRFQSGQEDRRGSQRVSVQIRSALRRVGHTVNVCSLQPQFLRRSARLRQSSMLFLYKTRKIINCFFLRGEN